MVEDRGLLTGRDRRSPVPTHRDGEQARPTRHGSRKRPPGRASIGNRACSCRVQPNWKREGALSPGSFTAPPKRGSVTGRSLRAPLRLLRVRFKFD